MDDPQPPTTPLPLPPHELYQELQSLPGWRLSEDGRSLVWSYRFSTPTASNGFLRRALEMAGLQGRSPDLERRAGAVTLWLTTDEVQAVTYQDIRLARAIVGSGRMPGAPEPRGPVIP